MDSKNPSDGSGHGRDLTQKIRAEHGRQGVHQDKDAPTTSMEAAGQAQTLASHEYLHLLDDDAISSLKSSDEGRHTIPSHEYLHFLNSEATSSSLQASGQSQQISTSHVYLHLIDEDAPTACAGASDTFEYMRTYHVNMETITSEYLTTFEADTHTENGTFHDADPGYVDSIDIHVVDRSLSN